MDMEDLFIKYWNRGAEERYGWTADQAVDRVVHDLLKTVFPLPLGEVKATVMRAGRWEGELLHTKKDGSQLVVASRWALQRDEQAYTPVAILETNNDITERKRAEDGSPARGGSRHKLDVAPQSVRSVRPRQTTSLRQPAHTRLP